MLPKKFFTSTSAPKIGMCSAYLPILDMYKNSADDRS
jgi:hypothetical protein